MGGERLIIDYVRRADRGVLLRVSGKLQEETVPLLDGVLHALRAEAATVVIDLSGVDHIDGRGLELLLAAEDAAVRGGSSVEVTGVRESLRAHRPAEDE